MSTTSIYVLEIAIASVVLGGAIIGLSHRGLLSFKYTVGWLLLCSVGIGATLILPVLAPVADLLHLSASALLVLMAGVLVTALFVQLSISISGTQEQVRTLTEENAGLRLRLEQLERPVPPYNE